MRQLLLLILIRLICFSGLKKRFLVWMLFENEVFVLIALHRV